MILRRLARPLQSKYCAEPHNAQGFQPSRGPNRGTGSNRYFNSDAASAAWSSLWPFEFLSTSLRALSAAPVKPGR